MGPRRFFVVHRFHFTVVQDQRLLCSPRRLSSLVRRDDHCRSFLTEFPDELVYQRHSLGIEPRIGFIQERQLERSDPELSQDDPLTDRRLHHVDTLIRHSLEADPRQSRPIHIGPEFQT